MNKELKVIKIIFTYIFCATVFVEFIMNNPIKTIEYMSSYLGQGRYDAVNSKSMTALESDYSSSIYKHRRFIDLNGYIARILNMDGYYSDMGMYITDDNYIVTVSDYTSTDFEVDEITRFKSFLDSNDINFLYVNEPTKYLDDSYFNKEFGIETYSNRNADLFIDRIRDNKVNVIDLRDNIKQENIDIHDMFYRTDHHWTVPAGLWATRIIAQGLNDYCGYDINTTIYDNENYEIINWNNCWLGEQGRKIAKSYVGLDNFTEIKPKFETSFTFKEDDGTIQDGSFDDFIYDSIYNLENDIYDNLSWHYSYLRTNCINNNVENGKILIIGDSYNHVVHPFLALGVHEIDSLILRDCSENFKIRDYILANDYDTVVIAYAQFMIGTHDDNTLPNYPLFILD